MYKNIQNAFYVLHRRPDVDGSASSVPQSLHLPGSINYLHCIVQVLAVSAVDAVEFTVIHALTLLSSCNEALCRQDFY